MSEFRIEKIEDGKIAIYTPYDKKFVQSIKKIGSARWSGSAWTVPEDYIDDIRTLMLDIYGRDDLQNCGETVDAEVDFIRFYDEKWGAVVFCGKTLAQAWGRDSGATVGDDVILVEGDINSGGSRVNWYTRVSEGSKFIVKKIPKSRFEKEKDELNSNEDDYYYDENNIRISKSVKYINYKIISEIIDKDALLAEKDRLEKRIEEIEKLIKTDS